MARTIGRRRPASSPRGDHQSKCSYCGVAYYKSELRRDGSGQLMCVPCDGIDAGTLDQMNRDMTPPAAPLLEQTPGEAKVVEPTPDIKARIGGVTFSS